MNPGNIGGNYNPYSYGSSGPSPNRYIGNNPGFGPTGSTNPYAMMGFFQKLLQTMMQLQSGWQSYLNPGLTPRPPVYGQPVQPPIQALYGVAIGPTPNPGSEPPIQALYGVAIGPRPQPIQEPPIQALYGVAIGPRPQPILEPPIQALYGVAIGPGIGSGPPIQALYGVAIAG